MTMTTLTGRDGCVCVWVLSGVLICLREYFLLLLSNAEREREAFRCVCVCVCVCEPGEMDGWMCVDGLGMEERGRPVRTVPRRCTHAMHVCWTDGDTRGIFLYMDG